MRVNQSTPLPATLPAPTTSPTPTTPPPPPPPAPAATQLQTSLHAARIQHRIRTALVQSETCTDLRTASYYTALGMGTLTLPALLLIPFVRYGWTIPTGTAVACVVLFLLAGPRTEEIEELSAQMAERNRNQELPL